MWAVGLQSDLRHLVPVMPDAAAMRARNPKFREMVLNAYDERCVICGQHLAVGGLLFGLEAAHIRAICHEGPNELQNGLALCTLHHKAFDIGAIGLEPIGRSYGVIVSDQLSGESVDSLVSRQGDLIAFPKKEIWAPSPAYVDWHRRAVFRPPPRAV